MHQLTVITQQALFLVLVIVVPRRAISSAGQG